MTAPAPHAPSWWRQALRFGAVGLLNTGIDYAVFYLLVQWTPFARSQDVAKCLSFLVAILNGFVLNARWTFGGKTEWRLLVRFLIVSGLSLAANVLAFRLVFALTHNNALGVLAASAASFCLGFLLHKLWTFRAL